MCAVCLCVSSSGCSVLVVLFCSLACFLCVPGFLVSWLYVLCAVSCLCGVCCLPYACVVVSVLSLCLLCVVFVSLVGACVLCPCCSVLVFRCLVVLCLLPVVVVVVSVRSCVCCWLIGWLFCGVAQVVFAFWVCVFGVCFGVAGWGGVFWVLAYRSF